MNSKASVSEDQHANHRRILKALLSDASLGNKLCADCHGRQPTWASVNLGVFVCLTCSGIHRSLGVHVSQVRSTTLDTWTPDQVDFVRSAGGNDACNGFWEAELGKHFVRPDGRDVHALKRFIVDKYVHKRFLRHDIRDKVHRMDMDQFARYYAGVAGGRVATAVGEPGGASLPDADLLQLDVACRGVGESADAIGAVATGGHQQHQDDMWGDIEWVSGEGDEQGMPDVEDPLHPRESSREKDVLQVEAATGINPPAGKRSVDDILALFDR